MTAWKSLSDKIKSNAPNSYSSYLAKEGKNELYDYYDSIRQAQTTRALSDSDYGKVASSLLSSGLSQSGYSDYLKSNADKSYIKSIAYAEEEKMTDEYKNKSGYEKYLSDFDALQNKIAKSLIESIGKGTNFDYNNAFEKAISAGLEKTLAEQTAYKAISEAKNNTYLAAITFAKANSLTPKKAKEYAKFLGLDDITAERVYQEISVFNKEEKEFYSSMSPEDYYQYILSQSKK